MSSQNDSALSLSRITSRTVSSPAREPTSTLIFMLSSAAQAALANHGMVFSTTIFCAQSKLTTLSRKIVRSLPLLLNVALCTDTA